MNVLTVCLFVHHIRAWWPMEDKREHGIPKNWNSRQFWATVWIQELNPCPLDEQEGPLTTELSLQPASSHLWPCQIFPISPWICNTPSPLFLILLIQNGHTLQLLATTGLNNQQSHKLSCMWVFINSQYLRESLMNEIWGHSQWSAVSPTSRVSSLPPWDFPPICQLP